MLSLTVNSKLGQPKLALISKLRKEQGEKRGGELCFGPEGERGVKWDSRRGVGEGGEGERKGGEGETSHIFLGIQITLGGAFAPPPGGALIQI